MPAFSPSPTSPGSPPPQFASSSTLLKTSGKGIACVSCEGKLGNPCIFTQKYYDFLLSINGDKGGKAVITAHRDDTAVLKVNDVKELTDMDVKL